jgi:hypothetical protein
MGKKADEWSDCVNDNNYKFYTTDPISAVYSKLPEWNSNNVFIDTKNILIKNYNFDIVW